MTTHIYDAMVAAGVPIDNHYSDLYVPVNDTTIQIVRAHKARPSVFRSNLDGRLWYDIPFAYLPYWAQRAAR